LASTAISYLAGRASDRLGRRPVVVGTLTTHGLAVGALQLVGHRLALGLPIAAAAWTASAATWPQLSALVADAADATRREAAFAATRVATTVGMTAGPALASLLLVADGWDALLVGVAALDLSGAAIAAVLLRSPPSSASPQGDARSLRQLVADRRFLALLLSTFFGFAVFVAFETVLPVVAVSDYALAPAVWGAIFLVNPVVAMLLQVRLTERLAERRAAVKLAAAMLLMGWPFLLLLANASLAAIALVVLLVALGDVVWVPTRQALAIDLAASGSRGATSVLSAPGQPWPGPRRRRRPSPSAVGPAITGSGWPSPSLLRSLPPSACPPIADGMSHPFKTGRACLAYRR
jgi:predicted MFS family arabinose efflux permease